MFYSPYFRNIDNKRRLIQRSQVTQLLIHHPEAGKSGYLFGNAYIRMLREIEARWSLLER